MSLFSICLEFVASNIHLVESFDGFPDIIGQKIFNESARKRQFVNIKDSEETRTNLKVFFDAYGRHGILDSLRLRHSHLFVNDAVNECPWLLEHLTSLDLSFCGLGDKHELLPQITLLLRLETLNIKANSLTDEGVRVLTAPLRFHGKSHGLKYLNLSSNNITIKSLTFLRVFKKLCAMDVSHTFINEQTDSLKHIICNLSPHRDCACFESICHITTQGWAKDVVESWKDEYYMKCLRPSSQSTLPSTPTCSLSEQKEAALDTKSFYSRKKPVSRSNDFHFDFGSKHETTNKLVLVTNLFHCSGMLDSTSPSLERSVHDQLSSQTITTKTSTSDSLQASEAKSFTWESGFKRKAEKNSQYHKRFCFQKHKQKLDTADFLVNKPEIFVEKRKKEETSLITTQTDNDNVLDFYSKPVKGNGDNKMNSCKQNLVEELENCF